VRLWDVATSQELRSLIGHSEPVFSVVVVSIKQQLVSGSADRTVRLWDAHSGACHHILEGRSGQVRTVAMRAGGDLVASGSSDASIKLWDTASGVCIATLRNELPYDRMDITDATGLTEAQKITLKALGAIEHM